MNGSRPLALLRVPLSAKKGPLRCVMLRESCLHILCSQQPRYHKNSAPFQSLVPSDTARVTQSEHSPAWPFACRETVPQSPGSFKKKKVTVSVGGSSLHSSYETEPSSFHAMLDRAQKRSPRCGPLGATGVILLLCLSWNIASCLIMSPVVEPAGSCTASIQSLYLLCELKTHVGLCSPCRKAETIRDHSIHGA